MGLPKHHNRNGMDFWKRSLYGISSNAAATAKVTSTNPFHYRYWPFATFSSAAEFGGYRSTTDIHPGLPVMGGLGRARRASVAERIQHVANLCGGEFRRHASRRILARDVEGALTGVRIAAGLHPAVLLAFADRARFLQHGDRTAAQRPDRRSSLPLISIEPLLPGTNP